MGPARSNVVRGKRRRWLRADRLRAAGALALLLLGGFFPPPRTLTLLDARTRVPVAGALVFAPGDLRVFRSDRRGQVTLPAEYVRQPLEVHGRLHRPLRLATTASGEVLLELDSARVTPIERRQVFARKDTLRGTYGPYRENNDLLTYDLNIAVDVAAHAIAGSNTIRFRMLQDGQRIQLDLFDNMAVDSIVFEGRKLAYAREFNAVFVDFPDTLRAGHTHQIAFFYSGKPIAQGRFGGMVFQTDSLGNPWVYTANQGIGASLWWPNKDQQPDEVDSMTMRVTVPAPLQDVSNGRFLGATDLGNGTTRYDWQVHYPINNYSVSLNIARFDHFADTLGAVTLDFYALPYHLEAARRQFAQAQPMIECYQQYFGDYPFPKDGYKLVEAPYSGMEHQSAVTYGNLFQNGYLARDWTGVGISPRFDFIIIHESGHEWFGNAVTANDVSDAWIHEGFDTYAEAVYVECRYGYADAIRYVNGYQEKVRNEQPIVGPSGVNQWPPQDQYFKGALFLNTLRHVVANDSLWWALLKAYAEHFRYQDIWTTDVINFFNERLHQDLRPVFEQYLYYPKLPVLELEFGLEAVRYRWQADVADFDMPVDVRAGSRVLTLHPTTAWKTTELRGVRPAEWAPMTDRFYIGVKR